MIVSIDAGTTGVRALAFDEHAALRHQAYRPLRRRFPRPGWVEQDPEEIWRLVQSTLAEVCAALASDRAPVAAVGIANQRETVVAWDRATGRPLAPAIVWQDRRTAARCEALAAAGLEGTVRETTGLVLDPYFSGSKFEWLLGERGVASSPDLALGTVDSWLVWKLTGGTQFATDPSNASRTLLYDIERARWSEELCALFGVPVGALPEVRATCGRFGAVAGAGALDGVAVGAVAGDQQAALFGQACVVPGMAKVTYGTGSFVLALAGVHRPPPAPGLLTTVAWDLGDHGARQPEFAVEGSTFVAGAAIQWLRDGLGVIGSAADLGPLAESVADAGGLVAVPAFAGLGSPWWDPRARGTVVGIAPGATRAHLARAVVEAMAFSVRDMVDAMTAATGTPCPQLRADGGASVMPLLLQLQADQLQVPVVRPLCTESSGLGAALLAGIAAGVWGGPADAAAAWRATEEHQPTIERDAADAAYGRWLDALERARRWTRDE